MYIISNHLFVRNNCWDFTNLFTNLSHFVFSTIVFIAYSQVESYWEPSIRSVRDIIDIVRREISRSRITSSRRITQRGKRRVKFSLGNVNAEKKKRERRGSKKGWFHGFVRWKSYAQGMPRGLIRKRLDWFDSKANNATSRAWWNSEGYGRD